MSLLNKQNRQTTAFVAQQRELQQCVGFPHSHQSEERFSVVRLETCILLFCSGATVCVLDPVSVLASLPVKFDKGTFVNSTQGTGG